MANQFYEQLLRKVKSSYVSDEKNFEDMAYRLSNRLRDALKTFLHSNSILPTGEAAIIWANNLDKIFLGALQLKAQTALRSGQHNFYCLPVDQMFDAKEMAAEAGTEVQGDPKVLVTLFPMLVQRKEPQTGLDNGEEDILFRASVVLQ